ncbi:MAG: hydrogen peroxide-inducible genes activator [Cyclobacteriaceae bacterium]
MTLSQLEYALTVLEFGSFSKASNKLSLSQPALSSQILKLEDEIGFRLFDRSSSPMTATNDGQAFLLRAQDLVTSAADLKKFSLNQRSDFGGELKIGIIPTLSPFLVPLFSKRLGDDYPLLRLDVTEMITEQVIRHVRSGTLDAGIISTPAEKFGIETEALFYEKFYFYSSKDLNGSQLQVNEINLANLWLLEEGNCFRDQVNDFCNLKPDSDQKQVIYRCNSIDSLIRMVDNHGGFTILPELTTISLNDDQEMNISTIEKKAREIGIITRKSPNKARFIDLLKKYILENIPKHMLSNEGLEVVDPGITQ